jgi:hypothetical protein
MARTLCRITVLFLLAVLLTAPWSAAAEPRVAEESAPRSFGQAWSWLSALWSEIGCIIDPSGLCRLGAENLDTGCGIDPSGGCRDSSEGGEPDRDIGCGIDPDGGCGQ